MLTCLQSSYCSPAVFDSTLIRFRNECRALSMPNPTCLHFSHMSTGVVCMLRQPVFVIFFSKSADRKQPRGVMSLGGLTNPSSRHPRDTWKHDHRDVRWHRVARRLHVWGHVRTRARAALGFYGSGRPIPRRSPGLPLRRGVSCNSRVASAVQSKLHRNSRNGSFNYKYSTGLISLIPIS